MFTACSHDLCRSGAGILPRPLEAPLPSLAALVSAAAFNLFCLRFPPSHASCMINNVTSVTLCRLQLDCTIAEQQYTTSSLAVLVTANALGGVDVAIANGTSEMCTRLLSADGLRDMLAYPPC